VRNRVEERAYIKVADLTKRYDDCAKKTVERMLLDPTFPEVFRLTEGGHRYVYVDDLARWERSKVVRRRVA
jgi:phage pi2 protein 07